ncbi:helix-hairpin-helix domain-containing protein [Leadbettera azotonutricia]|uniref:Transcriptional accessory protein n=1 Tax=Leadbettera azotonutricia (strain ATCC BAA-888 / DSM 13862 / ZAS-9) TaxID=545695 RepID=F5YEH7_LEAAZ|nr:Tex family protein [Leadbettera azotonutricia]AEF80986.1 transcriptional accessory protein [Leadbettera azotonutricia ZAS-9]
MEFTQEFITNLKVNEVELMRRIAGELNINISQVSTVVGLLGEGSTVPFIARYRKEKTGSLDEVQVRDIEHHFSSGTNLETRRIEIIRGIFEQGKLTEPLYENISKAATLAELEDIYAPYKRKKKTRGMAAEEKGLGPLAEAMKELDAGALMAKAAEFIREDAEHPELSVASAEDALQGAMDIIAEQVSQDPENRAGVKSFYLKDGKIIIKGSGKTGLGDEDAKKTSTYQMYFDYTEALSQIKPHRVLAVNRGEREGVLEITIDVDENTAVELLQGKYTLHNDYHKTAVEDGLKRLLSPAVIREIRGDQGDTADDHGISVFSQNLKNLLMTQPIKGTRVLGVDPGIRTGTKCAFLDDTGKYLANFVIYNHKIEEAKKLILEGVKKYDIQLIAVGNGTGSKDVQEVVSQVITENNLEVLYTVVDEDGASVYSASDIAREEFPELDLTIRGAISIGRRLQDPLAELVKIDPKSIGVGLYQHDVNQKKLSETLDEVVSSVVNNVGVNLNTASASLLKYVSGINSSLARKIVKYRDEKGKIASRDELVTVPGMGPKSFEQCAGFLKIPESANPLDNTWVHPENYEAARVIRETITATGNLSKEILAELKEKHNLGDTTLNDIVEELKKPNRDPRDGYPKPIMQKGVLTFEDLHEGMMVTGKIKNVVDFGAFVDLGIKETALVHISELSDHFIKDPMDLVKVGDVLEFRIISLDNDRRRIGLSRKTERSTAPTPDSGAKKNVVAVKAGGASQQAKPQGPRPQQTQGSKPGAASPQAPRPNKGSDRNQGVQLRPDDDGTMYNPFAEAFRKMQEKGKK